MKAILKLYKPFLILAFLLFSNISFAQTKEETISWLKEKLLKCIDREHIEEVSIISIDECEIIIGYKNISIAGAFKYHKYQITLPTDVENITNDDGLFMYKAADIILKDLETEKRYSARSTRCCLRIEEREENIRERIVKAMKHLATFCPKKKETF